MDVPENFRGDTALIAASEVKLVMKIIIVENWEEIIENYFNFDVTQCKMEVRIWSGKNHISKWPKSG